MEGPMKEHNGHHHGATAAVAEKDPVCGMDVVPGQAPGGSTDHAGKTHWFCSQGCREKFVGDPALRRAVADEAGRRRHRACSGTLACEVDLPDAPADRPGRTRELSDLWHGPGADDCHG